jgi:hypothetical protein
VGTGGSTPVISLTPPLNKYVMNQGQILTTVTVRQLCRAKLELLLRLDIANISQAMNEIRGSEPGILSLCIFDT